MKIRKIVGKELENLLEMAREFEAVIAKAEDAGLKEFTYNGSVYRKHRTGGWGIVLE